MTPAHIVIIIGSTRPGRFADTVAGWFVPLAQAREDLTVDVADLRDFDFPYYDQPVPASRLSREQVPAGWAEVIERADGFVIITPEYNYGYPAVLKSALDCVYAEWNRKPVAFVSYGGWSGGTRAVQQLREVVVELQMAPIRGSLVIQFAPRAFAEDGSMKEPALYERAAAMMLDDLSWWAQALRAARGAGSADA